MCHPMTQQHWQTSRLKGAADGPCLFIQPTNDGAMERERQGGPWVSSGCTAPPRRRPGQQSPRHSAAQTTSCSPIRMTQRLSNPQDTAPPRGRAAQQSSWPSGTHAQQQSPWHSSTHVFFDSSALISVQPSVTRKRVEDKPVAQRHTRHTRDTPDAHRQHPKSTPATRNSKIGTKKGFLHEGMYFPHFLALSACAFNALKCGQARWPNKTDS